MKASKVLFVLSLVHILGFSAAMVAGLSRQACIGLGTVGFVLGFISNFIHIQESDV